MHKYSASEAENVKGTNWSAPELIVQANRLAEKHGRCLILLDDFHKLSGGIQEAMYEFLLERKLGDYMLHKNVAIICAMNFSKESGADTMEEPIKDRLSLLKVEFDFEYWFEHYGRFLHHYVSSFLRANSHLILEDETVDLQANGSPRSYTQLSNEFELYDLPFIQENAVFLTKQKVTPGTATELAKHITYMEAIDFTKVIADRRMQDISEIPLVDRLIWAYIINYISTPEDAAYLINLINTNANEQNFIGFIASELYGKHLVATAGKEIPIATQIVLAKLLEEYDEANFKLTPKQKELLEATNFTDAGELLQIAAVYTI
jgi:hypothetical protein